MIHSGFITAGDRVAQRFLNFAWTQLFAWLHSGRIGRSHDSFYPRHKTVKLTKWHYAEKSMNVRVYISPFSQCQCWLFSSVYSATCTGDRVYSGLSCHLSSSSETRGSKNINCGQRIEWKKQVRDKNVSLADGKRPQEKQSVNLLELERLLFCLFWWCGHVELVKFVMLTIDELVRWLLWE